MPGSSNTSFIPKRNPTKNIRTGVKKPVFVGTFIIRILFVATLLATAGVYAYKTKLASDLNNEIVRLDSAIAGFKEADLFRVMEVDTRMIQAKYRLAHSASIVSILDALEKSTVSTAEITDLTFERIDDKVFEVQSTMKTDTFDSVIFQREILESSDKLVVAEIDDLLLQAVPPNNGLYENITSSGESLRESVTFKALLTVDTEKISHQVVANSLVANQAPAAVTNPTVVEDPQIEQQSNQEGI
jgi:hypothetical protein